MPEPESLLTALSCGDLTPGADLPDSLAVLQADVAAVVNKLAKLPAWQAGLLWQARLAQDWYPLPESLRDALASRGLVAFTEVALRALTTARDAASLLARAEPLAERPWLVTQALLVLGTADALRWRGGEHAQRLNAERQRLGRVADGVWTLVQALPMHFDSASPPTDAGPPAGSHLHDALPEDWVPGPAAPGAPAAAWHLGAAATRQRAPEVGALDDELEGVALGVHGSLHRLLDEVADTAEALLKRPSPATASA